MTKERIITATVIIVAFALAFWLGARYGSSRISEAIPSGDSAFMAQSGSQIVATFSCDDGKSIWAAFGDAEVALSLSDGRNIVLPHATSGSGARYAEQDESIVFWNKGDSATLSENGEATFTDCDERR